MQKEKSRCDDCTAFCSSNYIYKIQKGLNPQVIKAISEQKEEPKWMLDYRLKALEFFNSKDLPKWGPDLNKLDINDLCFYIKTTQKVQDSWENISPNIKQTFDDLGVPQAEKKYLGGLGAQYESETVYHNLKKEWEEYFPLFFYVLFFPRFISAIDLGPISDSISAI